MLLDISTALTRIVLILLMIFGTVGNVLNLIILTRARLLRSTSTLYLIAASIDNILAIYLAVLNRLLIDGFSIDVGSFSDILCKIRAYFGFICLALSPYFFILACFDQYCASSTSLTRRSWSTKRNAKRCIFAIIIFIAILYSHVAIFFQTQNNGSVVICFIKQGFYQTFWSLFYLIVYSICPCILMSVLCLNILINIRYETRRIRPALPNINHLSRRLDRNLFYILFSNFVTEIVCILPFAIISVVNLFANNNGTVMVFVTRIVSLTVFASYSTNFYVYTISSEIYRREFLRFIGLRV